MIDREKATEWLEFDYFPRVGAYRKDCKTGCDACMPKHNGDNYCDIDMLGKILALLKEQEPVSSEALKAHYGKMYKCKGCGLEWYQQTQRYCQHCGKAVRFR